MDTSYVNPLLSGQGALSRESIASRVENFRGHAIHMLESLASQHRAIKGLTEAQKSEIDKLYETAKEKIVEIERRILENPEFQATNENKLREHHTEDLQNQLKAAEKELAKIISDTNVTVAGIVGTKGIVEQEGDGVKEKMEDIEAVRKHIRSLATSWGVNVRLFAMIFGAESAYGRAVRGFEDAKHQMELMALKKFFVEDNGLELRGVDAQRVEAFQGEKAAVGSPGARMETEKKRIESAQAALKDRKGVVFGSVQTKSVTESGSYTDMDIRLQVFFDPKKARKQVKQFSAQRMSLNKRETLTKQINAQTTSKSIPLNVEFDEAFSVSKKASSSEEAPATQGSTALGIFGKIFGHRGLSSLHRTEKGIVNAWDSSLTYTYPEGHPKAGQKRMIYSATRHGVTACGKSEKRSDVRKATADEAALELLQANLLKELKDKGLTLEEAQQRTPPLSLHLTSLSLLSLVSAKLDGEERMFDDQKAALTELTQKGSVTIDGKEIPVTFTVSPFNFAVAAKAIKAAKMDGVGSVAQTKVFLDLTKQHEINKQAWTDLKAQRDKVLADLASKGITPNASLLADMAGLEKDIETLMATPSAYFEGQNQYILPAMIMNWTNRLDEIAGGNKGAANCMSGKDRTGIFDCIAEAMALTYAQRGTYPTLAELRDKNSYAYKAFERNLMDMLAKSPSLDILEINTGARGFKVEEETFHELDGFSPEVVAQVLGVSRTTKS